MIQLRDIARTALVFGGVLFGSYAIGATVGLFMSPSDFNYWGLLQAGIQDVGMTLGYAAALLGWRPLMRKDARVTAMSALVAAVSSIMTLAIATMYTQGVSRLGMLWVSFLSGAVVTSLLQLPWLRARSRGAAPSARI